VIDLFIIIILVLLAAIAIRMWAGSRLYNSPAMGVRDWFIYSLPLLILVLAVLALLLLHRSM
jgi:hypothetical protein